MEPVLLGESAVPVPCLPLLPRIGEYGDSWSSQGCSLSSIPQDSIWDMGEKTSHAFCGNPVLVFTLPSAWEPRSRELGRYFVAFITLGVFPAVGLGL